MEWPSISAPNSDYTQHTTHTFKVHFSTLPIVFGALILLGLGTAPPDDGPWAQKWYIQIKAPKTRFRQIEPKKVIPQIRHPQLWYICRAEWTLSSSRSCRKACLYVSYSAVERPQASIISKRKVLSLASRTHRDTDSETHIGHHLCIA